MNKIKIYIEAFNDLLDNEFLQRFQYEYKKQTISDFDVNYYLSKIKSFLSKLEETPLDDFLQYINNPEKILLSNSTKNSKYCANCKKEIEDKYNKGIVIIFNNDYKNHFCKCKEPKEEFNECIFVKNTNFFIFNMIEKFRIWHFKIIDILRDLNNRSIINFEINSLFSDIYGTIDSIKFQLFMINENKFIDEAMITLDFFQKNKNKIKEIQFDKKGFVSLANQIQDKIDSNKDILNLINRINLINLNDNKDNIQWIIDERNRLTHNCITISVGNYLCLSNPIFNFRLMIVFLLFIDCILTFYISLEITNNIHNSYDKED